MGTSFPVFGNQTGNYHYKLYDDQLLHRLSGMFNSVFIKCSERETINFVSSNIKDMLGYEQDELLGKSLFQFFHEQDTLEIVEFCENNLDIQDDKTFTIRIQKKDETYLWVELNIHFLQGSENKTEVMYILKVIPIEKEEDLLQNDKLYVLGQLAAGIAHEIRNPLTSLKGFIQLMKTDAKSHEHYLKIMESEIDEIETISKELMVLAKPNPADLKPYLLKSIFESSMTLLEGEIFQNRVHVFTKISQDHIKVICDEQRVKQVIINIMKNALDAMESKGKINVTIGQNETYGIISIKDEGKGIPKEMIPRLGKPFFTTKSSGNGLGLMMCYKIVEEHKGKIEVSSEVGKGTVFTVYLPLAKD